MSTTDWDHVEEFMLGEESGEEWLHFVSDGTPDYLYEHWQNSYEAQEEIDEYIEKRR
jgi:hypothetical protein